LAMWVGSDGADLRRRRVGFELSRQDDLLKQFVMIQDKARVDSRQSGWTEASALRTLREADCIRPYRHHAFPVISLMPMMSLRCVSSLDPSQLLSPSQRT
jgi:hypothetical protein